MATTTAQPSLDKQDPSGKPKSKLKRLVLLIVLVCAVAAAAAGGMYYFMVMQTEHGHPVQAPIPQPVFMQLNPLTVNLQGDDGQRYLRVGLSLKFLDPKAQDYLTEHMPEIRSRILLALSNKQPEDLETVDGKRALAQELKLLVEQPTQPGNRSVKIDDVLFTEFVVQ